LDERQPIFNVPGIVLVLLGVFLGVHLLLWGLLPESESERLLVALAFIPARFGADTANLPGGNVATFSSLVTHQFIHGNLTHLLVNSAWFLAFGSPIARRTGALSFLAFFLVCGVAGALLYLAVNGTAGILVVGASGSISGLMGGAFRFIFRSMQEAGAKGLANSERTVLMSLSETLRDRRILTLIIAWTVLNVVFAEGAPGVIGSAAEIAWEAHLGGFYAGLLLYGFFDRPPVLHDYAATAE
jgi:membrane associated rhomboid family serine protease